MSFAVKKEAKNAERKKIKKVGTGKCFKNLR